MAFDEGAVVHTGEDVTSADLARLVEDVPALREPVAGLAGGDESPAVVASAVELVLEGLHLSKRLNKDAARRPRHLPVPLLVGPPGPARRPGEGTRLADGPAPGPHRGPQPVGVVVAQVDPRRHGPLVGQCLDPDPDLGPRRG